MAPKAPTFAPAYTSLELALLANLAARQHATAPAPDTPTAPGTTTLPAVASEADTYLRSLGFVPFREFSPNRPPVPYGVGAIFGCQELWDVNAYVLPGPGRVLATLSDGTQVSYDSRCVNPKNTGLNFYNLDGTLRLAGKIPNRQFPYVPDPFGPGGPGGGFPKVPKGPGTGSGLNLYGITPGDVVKFLEGLGNRQDLGGLVQVVAALVGTVSGVRGDLQGLPYQFGGEFAPGFGALADAFRGVGPDLGGALVPYLSELSRSLDKLSPGLGERLSTALDQHAASAADDAAKVAAGFGASMAAATGPLVQGLIAAFGDSLGEFSTLYKGGIDTLLRAMLDVFRDSIEGFGPVTPANVDKLAAVALRDALTAGTTAQLTGMGLELLHPLKNMGVQQAIGLLAEFAGFSEIARPFFGATLRHAIGLPAEHRAALHFRTTLPPIETVRELAAIGIVGLEKYHERLELAGYPEPYPAALADIVYTPPSPRMVAQLLDGSESDRPWLARVFRRVGFSPEDAERATQAAEFKTTAPGRGRLVAALLSAYQKGQLPAGDLDAGLAGAGLSVTHRAYYRRVADLERRGARMEAIATEVEAQYKNDIVSRDAAGQLLSGLGFTDDEVTTRLVVGDLKRNQAQVALEVKGLEAELRSLKAKGLANATRQFRAGFLSRAEFVAGAVGMGYSPAYVANAADLAELAGPVKTTPDAAAIGTGALEEAQTQVAALVTQEVQLKRADRVAALVSLVQLGLPHDLATVLVDLAGALAGPNRRPGDYGFPTGPTAGGPTAAIADVVLGGLTRVEPATALFKRLLDALHLPPRTRDFLLGLVRDLRGLFGR